MDSVQPSVTDQDLKNLRETLEFWSNNCGGCEECGRAFGGKSQPEFELRELHAIVVELQERRAKDEQGR